MRNLFLMKGEDSSALRHLGRLLKIAWRNRRACIIVIALNAVMLLIGLQGLGFLGLGVDFIRQRLAGGAEPRWPLGWRPGFSSSASGVLFIAAGVALMALAGTLLKFWATRAQIDLLREVSVELRASLYDKLQRLGLDFYDRNSSSSIINRVTADVREVNLFLQDVVLQTFQMALSIGIYTVYMFKVHPGLTLACLATAPLKAGVGVWFSRAVHKAYQQCRRMNDEVVRILCENFQGIQVIKSFGRNQDQIDLFKGANKSLQGRQRWIFWRVSFFNAALGMFSQVNMTVLLGYGGWLVIRGELPLGSGLIVFSGLLGRFSAQLAAIANIANTIQNCLAGAQRIFEVLDSPISIQSPAQALSARGVRGAVRFEDVSFSYPGGGAALSGVSFSVEPGECVAVVGATGSGKSTLLHLLARFHDPEAGRLLLDGKDLKEYDLGELRRCIGLVYQENFLFSNTIAANISYADPFAPSERIELVANIAAAHEFVSDLPQGYETVVGERGVGLSGGQRQRLAIARALHNDPAVLLMDDPTASIDSETEEEILAAMHEAMKGRTTFIVAHRMSTLRRARKIIVLDRGRIVQLGTHEELVAQPGPYRDAAECQLAVVAPLLAAG